jgi:hypothetical protein
MQILMLFSLKIVLYFVRDTILMEFLMQQELNTHHYIWINHLGSKYKTKIILAPILNLDQSTL